MLKTLSALPLSLDQPSIFLAKYANYGNSIGKTKDTDKRVVFNLIIRPNYTGNFNDKDETRHLPVGTIATANRQLLNATGFLRTKAMGAACFTAQPTTHNRS